MFISLSHNLGFVQADDPVEVLTCLSETVNEGLQVLPGVCCHCYIISKHLPDDK